MNNSSRHKAFVKVDKINIKIALNLFKNTQPDLSDKAMLNAIVKFRINYLIRETPEIKREIPFIPVQYQREWMLRPDNHLKICNNCEIVQPWASLEEENEQYSCPSCGDTSRPSRSKIGRTRHTNDRQSVSRGFVYERTKEPIPKLIEDNLFIAHKDIQGCEEPTSCK